MRDLVCLILIFFCTHVRADIFEDNKDAVGRDDWQKAVAHDSRGFYYRNGLSTPLTSSLNPFEYRDQNNPVPPASRFNFKDNLFNQIQTPFFTSTETSALMRRMNRSPLMLLQYSSPAAADLFKHEQIAGHLKLDMFYRQIEDVQKRMGGDLGMLMDQAWMQCMESPKLSNGKPDLVKTAIFCSDRRPVLAGLNTNRASREILLRILNRLRVPKEQRDMILQIVPRWEITSGGYKMSGPSQRIGQVFRTNRDIFLESLHNLLMQYRDHQSVDPADLKEISLPGIQLTEQSLRDWLALGTHKAQLALNKIASQLAYLKTIAQYGQASEFLNRVMIHPSMQEGYKMVARQALAFVDREKYSLRSYREDIGRYAEVLGSVLNESEERRSRILQEMENDHDR